MARTFQHVKLRPNMTLIDNVAARHLSAHALGLPRRRLAARPRRGDDPPALEALHQLQRVGLGEKFGELAGNLPLGQQRLLEVARALAADPRGRDLDEPAAGLRRLEKQTLSDLLREPARATA